MQYSYLPHAQFVVKNKKIIFELMSTNNQYYFKIYEITNIEIFFILQYELKKCFFLKYNVIYIYIFNLI